MTNMSSLLLPVLQLFFLSSSLLTFTWKSFYIHTHFSILILQSVTSPHPAHVGLMELWQRVGFHINTTLRWTSSCLPGHSMVNGWPALVVARPCYPQGNWVTQRCCSGRHECVFVDGVWMVTVVQSLSSVGSVIDLRTALVSADGWFHDVSFSCVMMSGRNNVGFLSHA